MMQFGMRRANVLAVVAGGVATTAAYAQPQISAVGFAATDISADGNTVVGIANSSQNYMRWVRSTSTIAPLSPDGLAVGQIRGIHGSGDGSTFYGQIANTGGLGGLSGSGILAGRWTSATGWMPLPLIPNASQCGTANSAINTVFGMSSTGRFAVGFSFLNGCFSRAWVYDLNTNVTTNLGNFGGGTNETTRALCISNDGTLIGGTDQGAAQRPALWTWNGAAYVEQLLPTPADLTYNQGNVACMTRNGSTLAGQALGARQYYFNLATWTQVGGVWTQHDLGVTPALPSWVPPTYTIANVSANAISDDGAFIYGVVHYTDNNAPTNRDVTGAFIWTQQLGVTDLYDYLVAHNTTGIASFPSSIITVSGYDEASPSLTSVAGCSADGQHILGSSWIVDLPGSGCTPPVVTMQPAQNSGVLATQANMWAFANGSAPLTYQWYRNNVALGDGAAPWGDGSTTIYGSGTSHLQLVNVTDGITCVDQGTYYCAFTNGCGSAASNSWTMQVPNCCYANCDSSTTAPVLNVGDFTCFLQKYAAGDPYANCDSSTTPPVLNVGDFTCFLQKFAAGCP
jgi:hypothetical protein